jgi:hypothetical protein
MASPTAAAIYRTGPAPVALDYSKTLIQALAAEGDERLPIGPVSRIQLLLTCLVERLHDAIYVLPRQARDPGASPVNPDEYATDIAIALKSLVKYAESLPDDTADVTIELESLNEKLLTLRADNATFLDEAKVVRDKVHSLLVNL